MVDEAQVDEVQHYAHDYDIMTFHILRYSQDSTSIQTKLSVI